MPEGKHKKEFFKLMDDYIILHSFGEFKSKTIAVPQTGSYVQRREWADSENVVYQVAKNIENLKKDDKVLLIPHAKLRGIDKVTEIMEKRLGKKLTIDILDKENKLVVAKEEREKYFIVKEEDILCIVL